MSFYVRIQRLCYTSLVDYYRSRLFCFVLTNQDNLEDRARAAYETWGHRCGRFVLITRLNSSRSYTIYENENINIKHDQLPIQYIPTLPNETYSHLPDKVREILLFLNKYYPNYDWYLKADDDTYVIIENLLRFLISTIKRRPKPVLYGYRFREDYYVSGGSGYVLTRKGLDLFGSYMNDNLLYARCNSTMEDMMVGSCLQIIFSLALSNEIKDLTLVGETIDDQGRERFHPLTFRVHFNGPKNKTKREWIYFRPFHHNLFGYEALSETTISFHYTVPEDMYQIHSLLYDIRQFDKEICRLQS
ncbi:unnamed protein product [Adineta steineri]|uniref:N-acetylgalactosaminide beta-1,3-galactosyltransferase n=1 Tax=Adineta steineri TaxID=433720 RepID=A0A814DU44_9BILA|nr:unnamed protein product [Adineta steineri]CAF0961755.1 unnamed protein product [Adineta steineri]